MTPFQTNSFQEEHSYSLRKTTDAQCFLEEVNRIIEINYSDENFSLLQLCAELNLCRSQVYRKMKAYTETAPSDLIRLHRIKVAHDLLSTTNLSIADIAFQVGFREASYFSKVFKEAYGYSPSNIS